MYYVIYRKNNKTAVTKTASKYDAEALYFQLRSSGNTVSVYDPDNNLLIGRPII